MLRSKEMEDHGKYLGPLFLLPSSFLLLSLISQIYPETILLFQKQENFRKTSTSASLTTLKPLTMWITANCGKFLKRWEYQATLPVFWEIYMQVKKQQLELDMEQWTDSKQGKEYV